MRTSLGTLTMNSTTPRMSYLMTNYHHGTDESSIDLSRTENHLIQDEIDDICKTITEARSTHRLSCERQESKLLDSLSRFFNTYFNAAVPVVPSQIALAGGTAKALDVLLQNICDPGDGIMIPGPCRAADGFHLGCWAHSSLQAVIVNVPKFTDTFTTKLISTLSDTANKAAFPIKALLLTNPHVPFGQCYPQEVLEACLRFCHKRGIHYISDEVYALTSFPCAEISDPVPFISALSLDARALGCTRSRIHTMWSISKDFGTSGFHMGCTITQTNDDLVRKISNSSKHQITAPSATFTTTLLSSHNLPFLIAMNSARLAESYILITSFFLRYNIKYIPATAGLSIFARLAPRAETWDDEAAMVATLREAGVVVSAGRQFNGVQKEKGWARLSFSVGGERLREALRRIEIALGFRRYH